MQCCSWCGYCFLPLIPALPAGKKIKASAEARFKNRKTFVFSGRVFQIMPSIRQTVLPDKNIPAFFQAIFPREIDVAKLAGYRRAVSIPVQTGEMTVGGFIRHVGLHIDGSN